MFLLKLKQINAIIIFFKYEKKNFENFYLTDILVYQLQDFNYMFTNCFAITLELSCCRFPPASELKKEWENNRDALINYMYQVHIGVKGFITAETSDSNKPNKDGILGKPLPNAVISVEGIDHDVTTSLFGDYWRLLVPGRYRITAKADGYEPQTKSVEVFGDKPTQLNFTLRHESKPTNFNSQNSNEQPLRELDILVSQINLLTDAEKRYSLFLNEIKPELNTFVYHNNEQMVTLMKSIKEKCPSITSIITIGKSVNGTNIYDIIFSDNPLVHEEGEPEFKYIGNMHGDEVLGRELLLQFMVYLCDNYGRSELITRLIDSVRIHIIPSLNPDGYNLAVDKKSPNGRLNANQFDLNRNFPTSYAKSSINARSTENVRNKKSPNDSSDKIQPETSTIMALSKLYPFVLSANLHSGALVVNYPFDDNAQNTNTNTPSPDDGTFKMLAKAYSMVNA